MRTKEIYKLYSYAIALQGESGNTPMAHAGFVTSRNDSDALQTATAYARHLYGDDARFVKMNVSVCELAHTFPTEPAWKEFVLFSDF